MADRDVLRVRILPAQRRREERRLHLPRGADAPGPGGVRRELRARHRRAASLPAWRRWAGVSKSDSVCGASPPWELRMDDIKAVKATDAMEAREPMDGRYFHSVHS